MAQAQLSTVQHTVFHQYEKDGVVQFRTKFGRNKAIVFRQYEGYFHVDLYNNNINHRTGSANYAGVSLGLDELDAVIAMRDSLESLKNYYPKQRSQSWSRPGHSATSTEAQHLMGSGLTHLASPTVEVNGTAHFQQTAHQKHLYQAIPVQMQDVSNRLSTLKKTHGVSCDKSEERHIKLRRYDNVTPVGDDTIPQNVMEDFFTLMN